MSTRDEPAWRAQQRACRACHEKCPKAIYSDADRDAYPLFHETGNLDADVLFVLEAPNWADTFDEDKHRLTFDEDTDPTGRFFRKLLKEELRLEPEDVLVVNSVLCLPARKDGKYPVNRAIREQCVEHLKTTIDRVKPRVVAPLGGEALNALNRIERHGLKGVLSAAGKPVGWRGRTLLPLAHPSALGRRNRPSKEQRKDWRALRRVVGGSSRKKASTPGPDTGTQNDILSGYRAASPPREMGGVVEMTARLSPEYPTVRTIRQPMAGTFLHWAYLAASELVGEIERDERTDGRAKNALTVLIFSALATEAICYELAEEMFDPEEYTSFRWLRGTFQKRHKSLRLGPVRQHVIFLEERGVPRSAVETDSVAALVRLFEARNAFAHYHPEETAEQRTYTRDQDSDLNAIAGMMPMWDASWSSERRPSLIERELLGANAVVHFNTALAAMFQLLRAAGKTPTGFPEPLRVPSGSDS